MQSEMPTNDKKGGSRIPQRKADLITPSQQDQLYIDKFWSVEENWFGSPYGYSLVGAAFSRAFLNDKKAYESLMEFALRHNIGIPMAHKYGTNSGNPTLNTMEEIAQTNGSNLLEFLGFTPTEIRRAFSRIGLDYDAECARSERINNHPDHIAFRKDGPRAKHFKARRPQLADALKEVEDVPRDPAELIAIQRAREELAYKVRQARAKLRAEEAAREAEEQAAQEALRHGQAESDAPAEAMGPADAPTEDEAPVAPAEPARPKRARTRARPMTRARRKPKT